MTEASISPSGRLRRSTRALLISALAVTAGLVATSDNPAAAADDWMSTVNTYRAMSGLGAVNENPTWSAEGRAHSCYMLQNGIAHDEVAGTIGYTIGGDVAGNSGNVAVSSNIATTPRQHVELWMTGPFHAIGILRHSLRTSGFGLCAEDPTPTPWRSGGTLDVIRGIDPSAPRPTTPILFPGNGATVPLHSFVTEYPNPMTMCGWSGAAGLPLIAMMPSDVSSASATITGPNGPIETCSLHRGNAADPTAKAILAGDNAVVVMPRDPLADGTYTVTVNSNGGNVTWSFTVDRDAPLSATPQQPTPTPTAAPEPVVPPSDTQIASNQTRFRPVAPFRLVDSRVGRGTVRLQADRVTRIDIADPQIAAVSANFVAVDPQNHGFVTAYNCTGERPEVSTLSFRPGQIVANQAVVPLDKGQLCLYSLVDTDIVIDVNGYFDPNGKGGFSPSAPQRVHDSRAAGSTRLRGGEELVLSIAGSGRPAPADATSVALNVTVAETSNPGFLQVYPCGAPSAAEISTVNYGPDDFRPNSVVVPVDGKGDICIRSLSDTHAIVDYTGFFADDFGADYQPLSPIRLFDSRSGNATLNSSTNGNRVAAGQIVAVKVAGHRGIPADATAVTVNLTATDATQGSYLTAFPCGERPNTSNVNIVPWQTVSANGAMVQLSKNGELCVFALNPMHVIVDISGVYL